jgi:hypothetical protein
MSQDQGNDLRLDDSEAKSGSGTSPSNGGGSQDSIDSKTARKKLYTCWKNMLGRCYNSSAVGYKNYGARGITVCDRWRDSFPNFLEDMGYPPSPKHQLDRIDNDGKYEPSNCRWADMLTQAFNKRPTYKSKSGVTGVTWNARTNRWRVRVMIHDKSIPLGCYKDLNDAIAARQEGLAKWTT